MLLTPAFRNMDCEFRGGSARGSVAPATCALFRSHLPDDFTDDSGFALQLLRVFQSFETEYLLGYPLVSMSIRQRSSR
jgi:hypothetical protein